MLHLVTGISVVLHLARGNSTGKHNVFCEHWEIIVHGHSYHLNEKCLATDL